MNRPIKFMDETELREEAKRLEALANSGGITRDNAIRLSNVRDALRVIELVRDGKSPFVV